MVGLLARIGSALGGMTAFAIAVDSGGLSAWTTGALTAGALLLVAIVLFIPSETPTRRLGQLIHAWRASVEVANPEPAQSSVLPPSLPREPRCTGRPAQRPWRLPFLRRIQRG